MDSQRLAENLERVRGRIGEAARRGGRDGGDVRLVAVTKTVELPVIRRLLALGQADVGENRVRALLARAEALFDAAEEVRWHMIGHLQRNKVRHVLRVARMLHAVDSLRLAEYIDGRTQALELDAEVCIEVNVSGEQSKYGVAAEEAAELAERIAAMERVRCVGLMTMAPFVDDAERTRPVFARLRELRDEIRRNVPDCVELSMGMSNDYPVAVEEGATICRIGTALFEGT